MTPDLLPQPALVFQAIDLYLAHAYGQSATPPGAVRVRLDQLRNTPPDSLFTCPAFERDPKNPRHARLCLRLGNRFYPHMKLSIDPRPDGRGYLFRADTHDRHICPPAGSKEADLFRRLMEQNQSLSQSIESAWSAAGLPTFKSYLKGDLARRAAPQPRDTP